MTENNNYQPGTDYLAQTASYPQPPQHMKKKPPFWKKPIVWLPAVAAVVAFALGSGSTKTETVAAEPTPAVTVTPKPEVKTVTKEVTPAACLEYINLSEQAFTYSAEAMGYMSDGMLAASQLNVAGVEDASAQLKVLNPKINALAPDVNASKAACKAAN